MDYISVIGSIHVVSLLLVSLPWWLVLTLPEVHHPESWCVRFSFTHILPGQIRRSWCWWSTQYVLFASCALPILQTHHCQSAQKVYQLWLLSLVQLLVCVFTVIVSYNLFCTYSIFFCEIRRFLILFTPSCMRNCLRLLHVSRGEESVKNEISTRSSLPSVTPYWIILIRVILSFLYWNVPDMKGDRWFGIVYRSTTCFVF